MPEKGRENGASSGHRGATARAGAAPRRRGRLLPRRERPHRRAGGSVRLPRGATAAPRRGGADAFFRQVNDRIVELDDRFGFREELLELICECDDPSCTERVFI